MPSPPCLSSIELVRLTDLIELKIADPLERESVDEPDVEWQSSDGDLVDDSVYSFGYDDNGEGVCEGVGAFDSNDGYGSQQGKESRGN